MLDMAGFIIIYCLGAIVANGMRFVILDADILIFLRMEVNQFRTFFILETQFIRVGAASALAGARENSGLRHVCGQLIGWHLLCIIDAPRDNGLIRVPFEKIDDHFLPDAWDSYHAPVLASPGMGNAYPA